GFGDLPAEGAIVRRSAPGCERVQLVLELSSMGPDEVEDRPWTVFPAQHRVRLQAAEGEIVALGKGSEGNHFVARAQEPHILIAPARQEELAIELEREVRREGVPTAYRQVHRAGITVAEDWQEVLVRGQRG